MAGLLVGSLGLSDGPLRVVAVAKLCSYANGGTFQKVNGSLPDRMPGRPLYPTHKSRRAGAMGGGIRLPCVRWAHNQTVCVWTVEDTVGIFQHVGSVGRSSQVTGRVSAVKL